MTDVRNWFTFAASERRHVDGSEHEHYSDSGGKSGGQKEKLAYTILAASLAYQFGLVWGAQAGPSASSSSTRPSAGVGRVDPVRAGTLPPVRLQLLIVTPLQKIHVIEPYVSHVGFVHNPKATIRCCRPSPSRNTGPAGPRTSQQIRSATRSAAGS